MIEMPNSDMIPDDQSSTTMETDVLTTTVTMFMSTTDFPLNDSVPRPADMVFNDGHRLSIIVYSILFILSALGNISVLTLLIKRRLRTKASRLDFMLTHLAIADLMVTFLLMPLEIGWAFTVEWTAGDAMCRIMMFFRTFGLYLSSFILVCISVDRYYAVLKPLIVNENRGKIMISIAWTLSLLCSAPQSYIFHVATHPVHQDFTQCVTFNTLSDTAALIYNISCMLMMYTLPLLIIIFCYGSIYHEIFQKSRIQNSERFRRSSLNVLSRAKRRTLRMTITIVIVFAVCWTPYYCMVAWHFIDQQLENSSNDLLQKILYLFACTNSCANPVVYGIFNLKRNRTEKNTFSYNNTYYNEQQSQRRRTVSTRAENFSRESSKTICINCGDSYMKLPVRIEKEKSTELLELNKIS